MLWAKRFGALMVISASLAFAAVAGEASQNPCILDYQACTESCADDAECKQNCEEDKQNCMAAYGDEIPQEEAAQ